MPIISLIFRWKCDCAVFYRAILERGIATASRMSVCPSVTLTYRGRIGWNSSKIILRLVSLVVRSLSIPQHHGATQREHLEISTGIGVARVGHGKGGFQRTKAVISLKRGKIGPRLLLRTKRKSYTRFRLVPKSTTLDDHEGSLCTLFQNTAPRLLVIYF